MGPQPPNCAKFEENMGGRHSWLLKRFVLGFRHILRRTWAVVTHGCSNGLFWVSDIYCFISIRWRLKGERSRTLWSNFALFASAKCRGAIGEMSSWIIRFCLRLNAWCIFDGRPTRATIPEKGSVAKLKAFSIRWASEQLTTAKCKPSD